MLSTGSPGLLNRIQIPRLSVYVYVLFYLHGIVLSISRHRRPPPRKKGPQ